MIDPTLYAGKTLNPDDVYVMKSGTLDGVGSDEAAPPSPSITQLMSTDATVQEGAAARSSADRVRANWVESLGGAISNWDSIHIIQNVFEDKPLYEPTPNYNGREFVENIPMQLSEPEMAYMLRATSLGDSQHNLRIIQERREASQAAGDNISAAFLGAAVDPVYLATAPLGGTLASTVNAGRAGAAVAAGVMGAGAKLAAGGPVSTSDVLLYGMLEGAAGAMMYKAGTGMVKVDPDFPDQAMRDAARGINPAPEVAEHSVLGPNAINTDARAVVGAVDTVLRTRAQKLGESGQWNMRKTMANFGPVGKRVSNILFDNNSDLSMTSVEAHKVAIRSDLTSLQHVYEDQMMAALSADGHGLMSRLFKAPAASRTQARIEKSVQEEMYRREQLTRIGLPITSEGVAPRVTAMADALDAVHSRALKELKAAGVEGAEDLVEKAGWHHRTWSSQGIEEVTSKFVHAGHSVEAAHSAVVKMVAGSFRRANGWEQQLAQDVASSVVNRARRKGYFEDSILNGNASEATLKQMRDILTEEGVTGQRLERVLDVMRKNTDDTGKAGFLKHRVDMDYKFATYVNGERIGVTDLLDTRLTNTVDKYLDGVATQAAFARKGLTKKSDIAKMRDELLRDIPNPGKREEAAHLFDNVVNHMSGNPAGEALPRAFRLMQSYSRMISLANSGLWQVTEYHTLAAKYGLGQTLKYALKEAPGFRKLLETTATDKRVSGHLKDILTRHSDQNVRLRPFLQRFEDNYTIGAEDTASLAAQQGSQLVPYFNAMKFIHGHQARLTSNLILNRLEMAAKGDANAIKAMQKYGIDSQVMDTLKTQVNQHGFNVDKWSDGVWQNVRPAFAKMMDEAVLHSRLGDTPAFAAFDKVGKFMFTYKSFMLTAHNKVLMGTLARDGAGPATLLMAYQFPLAAMAVQAQSGLQGKGLLSSEDMVGKAMGQMGGLGLYGELAAVLSGQKSAFGSTGTIPIDLGYKLLGSTAQGQWGQAGAAVLHGIPLMGLLPPVRAAGNLMKE